MNELGPASPQILSLAVDLIVPQLPIQYSTTYHPLELWINVLSIYLPTPLIWTKCHRTKNHTSHASWRHNISPPCGKRKLFPFILAGRSQQDLIQSFTSYLFSHWYLLISRSHTHQLKFAGLWTSSYPAQPMHALFQHDIYRFHTSRTRSESPSRLFRIHVTINIGWAKKKRRSMGYIVCFFPKSKWSTTAKHVLVVCFILVHHHLINHVALFISKKRPHLEIPSTILSQRESYLLLTVIIEWPRPNEVMKPLDLGQGPRST